MSIHHTQELVLNWHITEACNYTCKYCYAHWCKKRERELIHRESSIERLLVELSRYFHPDNSSNLLAPHLSWSSLRLNIAGGEPLLYPKQVMSIIETAQKLNIKTSLITNGSRLNQKLIQAISPYLSLLGVSLDSGINNINRGIGRIDNNGKTPEVEELCELINIAQAINPNIRLKLNTVVNSLNWQEGMLGVIKKFNPDRWKVLRMLPVLNADLAVTNSQFYSFVERHHELTDIMCVEDNEDMSESYIMIDPYGRFFQNNSEPPETGYVYSPPILVDGADQALRAVRFTPIKFMARYLGGAA